MNSDRLIILRVASLLEGRDAQNESYRAAAARQQNVPPTTLTRHESCNFFGAKVFVHFFLNKCVFTRLSSTGVCYNVYFFEKVFV